ncbi:MULTISPECIES: hypothetical protein [Amycolatopsis]|uniref:ABC-2 family transporter protein n=2 Tax=Amycolatopsis TaxID=1813 RepID=A0A1I4DKA6_9PSEU|nr:hypothetical protein [Amycolatopsis sacchari]SFK92466.1 hypothetical protein SAMN05421835_14626 [Amycolatopsis sacchari]
MREALRVELLKARSGVWMPAVLAYALVLPFCAWLFTGKGLVRPGTDAAGATEAMLVFLVTCPMAATFLGGFLVTREYYYRSVARAVLLNRRAHVFVAKLVAGVAGGVAVGVVGAAGWAAFSAYTLHGRGQVLELGGESWGRLLGCVAACAVAGPLGVAVGWLVRNYYAAAAVSLLPAFGVELPLVLSRPDVARFLPDTALAGIARVQQEFPGILTAVPSLLVALLWLGVAAFAAWRAFARRELR